jgi:hypothetical protein
MNIITNSLKRSEKKQRNALIVGYTLNLSVIIIFLLFSMGGVEDIYNESLSPNDIEQLMIVLSSIVVVSIISIFFFNG